MAHDVFISYSSKDKVTADAACALLERNAIRCWIAPRDILPGLSWGASIIDAINGSRAMVLVFSGHANASPQVEREIERAVNRSLPIIPLRIEDVSPTKSLEYFISTPHWLDALTPPLEKHLERLSGIVHGILSSDIERTSQPDAPAAPHKVAGRRNRILAAAAALSGGAMLAVWLLLAPTSITSVPKAVQPETAAPPGQLVAPEPAAASAGNPPSMGSASLPKQATSPTISTPILQAAEPHETAMLLQGELRRVGCYGGSISGVWDRLSSEGVLRFNRYAHSSLQADEPTLDAVASVSERTRRVCPASCPRGQTESGGRCLTARVGVADNMPKSRTTNQGQQPGENCISIGDIKPVCE